MNVRLVRTRVIKNSIVVSDDLLKILKKDSRLEFPTRKSPSSGSPAISLQAFWKLSFGRPDVYSSILLTSSFAFCFDLLSVHVFGQSLFAVRISFQWRRWLIQVSWGRDEHLGEEARRRQTKLKLVHRNTFILLISLATGRKGTLLPFEDHTSTIQKAERSNPPPKQNYWPNFDFQKSFQNFEFFNFLNKFPSPLVIFGLSEKGWHSSFKLKLSKFNSALSYCRDS